MFNNAPQRVVFGSYEQLRVKSSGFRVFTPAKFSWEDITFAYRSHEKSIGHQANARLHRNPIDTFYKHGNVFYNYFGGGFSTIQDAMLEIKEMVSFAQCGSRAKEFWESAVECKSKGTPVGTRTTRRCGKAYSAAKNRGEVSLDQVLADIGPTPLWPRKISNLKTIPYCKYGLDAEGKPKFVSQSSVLNKVDSCSNEKIQDLDFEFDPRGNEKAFRKVIVRMQRAARADAPSRKGSRKKLYKNSERSLGREFKGLRIDDKFEDNCEDIDLGKVFKEKFVSQVNIGLVHKIDPKMAKTLEKVCDRFADIFDGCKGNMEETIDEIKGTFDKGFGIAESFKSFLWIALLATLGYFFFVKAPVHRVLIVTILASVVPGVLWNSVSHIFTERFESQGGLNLSWMSQIVTIGLSFFLFGGTGLFGSVKNIFRLMPIYSRTVTGVSDISAFLIGNIEACLNFLRSKFGAGPVSLMSTGKKEIDEIGRAHV